MIKFNIEITGDNVASIQSDIAKLLSAHAPVESTTLKAEKPAREGWSQPAPAPEVPPAKVEKPAAPAKAEKPAAPAKAEKPAAPADKPSGASLEELRALGMKLISASRSAELKTVVASFGATSISTLPADKYEEAKTKLEELLSV